MVACMMLFVGTMGVMAQKNIDKVVEELEKSDEVSINSVTKRDPKTRKVTRMIKTFSLTDIKMAKRLIAAFEKDEEYAISAVKDMPKGRKSAMKVNFTFTFQQDNEKSMYSLSTNENGKIELSINISRTTHSNKVSLNLVNDMDALWDEKLGNGKVERKIQISEIDIEIDMNDVRIDTYRASGAGGQHVNKTDSAVRITHLPTGIVVTCQNERSQLQNKDKCMQILRSKLLKLEMEKAEKEMRELKGDQKEINFGSQIRSYIMCPYTLVKDHRTNAENVNVNKVLDGDINIFIEAYLKGK